MEALKNYIPSYPEFFKPEQTESFEMPEHLFQNIDNEKELIKAIKTEYETVQDSSAMTVARLLDDYEIRQLRLKQNEILEDNLPQYEEALQEAKEAQKHAKDIIDAAMTHLKDLAAKVKDGTVDIELSPSKTFKIPKNGKYYFYSIINKQARLVAVKNIPEKELSKWYNANWSSNMQVVNE